MGRILNPGTDSRVKMGSGHPIDGGTCDAVSLLVVAFKEA
jgi:hypothetical protein